MRGAAPPCAHQRGAALLLVVLVVLMFSLTLFLETANTGKDSYVREQLTAEALTQAKAALIGYAATYRDTHPGKGFGNLLCPDMDNDGDAEGVCGSKGEIMIGRFPYKTLGLPDLRAADGECLWYVVSGSHKNNPKSPPLNWDTRGQIRILDTNGTTLIDPEDAAGGAVAAIIAPGRSLSSQTRPGGNLRCSGNTSNSIVHYLDGNSTGNYPESTLGVLTIVAGHPGSSANNDRVAWISARELYAPIVKRNDLLATKLGTTLLAEIKTCLDNQTELPLPLIPSPRDNGTTKTVFLGNLGKFEDLKESKLNCALSGVFDDAWDNWKNQLGYVVCKDQATACLNVNGLSCRGALVFSGRQADGNPRPSNADFETMAGNTFLAAPNLASYFSAGTEYAGAEMYTDSAPAKNIVACLKP